MNSIKIIFLSKTFQLRTLIVFLYFAFVGKPFFWIATPFLILYGIFLEKIILSRHGKTKYLFQFLLFGPSFGFLVYSSKFLPQQINHELAAIYSCFYFGVIMVIGFFIRSHFIQNDKN